MNLLQLRDIAGNIKKGERKEKEIEFLEQIWILLNPKDKEFINSEIFEGFLKILYSYSEKINAKKEIIKYINDYLKIAHFMEPKNNKMYYESPLNNKNIINKWPIDKIVDEFVELRKNIIAYKSNYFKKDRYKNNISENENLLKLNNIGKKKKEKHDFNKLYKSYMDKLLIREKTLERIREIQEKEKIKQCSKKPKILISKYNNYGENENNLEKNNLTVHDKLYERRNDKEKSISKIKEKYKLKDKNEENEEIIKDLFKPRLMNNENYNKTFNKEIKQKGYNNYIRRNREVIKQKEEKKKKEEDLYTGKNYEKTIKMNFQPPNIKDFENTNRTAGINKRRNSFENKYSSENKNDDEDDDNYEIEIKLPNGKKIKLKFNSNDDIYKKVDDFCKIFALNENIKQRIIKSVKEFRDSYYNQEEDEEEETEF